MNCKKTRTQQPQTTFQAVLLFSVSGGLLHVHTSEGIEAQGIDYKSVYSKLAQRLNFFSHVLCLYKLYMWGKGAHRLHIWPQVSKNIWFGLLHKFLISTALPSWLYEVGLCVAFSVSRVGLEKHKVTLNVSAFKHADLTDFEIYCLSLQT